MKPLKERIAIEQAYEDGINVEFEPLDKTYKWKNVKTPKDETIFYWAYNDYRIKPKPIEFWVNVYDDYISGAYETKAETTAGSTIGLIKTIKVREVTE